MVAAAILDFAVRPLSRSPMQVFVSNLAGGETLATLPWSKIQVMEKFKMATAASSKLRKQVYLGQFLADLY